MTNEELAELNKNRKIYQVCIVTKDLEKSMRDMIGCLCIGPWRIVTLSDKTMKQARFIIDGETMDNTQPFKLYAALSFVGDLQIELIQPVYGDTMYQRFIDSGREGLHHIKEKIAMENWEHLQETFLSQDMKVTQSGWVGTSFHAYFNTEPTLKFDFEVGNCPEHNVFPEECELRYFPEP
jgi:methylmalonyl-CoA/ethylmalonyl-CoA epimerase